ncbi:hypothetical protein ACJX0J_041697, partial [Zea mays]
SYSRLGTTTLSLRTMKAQISNGRGGCLALKLAEHEGRGGNLSKLLPLFLTLETELSTNIHFLWTMDLLLRSKGEEEIVQLRKRLVDYSTK